MNSPVGWWTRRREPERDKSAYPQQFATRVAEDISIQSAPVVAVPYTEFWNVGKDANHAWAFQQLYQSLAIPEWLSVQGWPFLAGMKAEPTSLVTPYQPQGWFNPQVTRSNIDQPPQTSLGMLASVQPNLSVTAPYLKLV